MKAETLLTVKKLRVQMDTAQGTIQPVDRINFTVRRGEIFALVGESGCGKTMTTLAINRLLPGNAQICAESEIFLGDTPLHLLPENQMREIRSKKISMIFQDPSLALNPVLTIGDQVREALNKKDDWKNEAIALLKKVRIPDPEVFLDNYPHQLSGGMKQRVMIAMALAQSPDLLIADEPTTALDVTTQAQVLNLLKELNQQLNMAILLITHDLGIVGQMADTVAVMYAGHIIELADKNTFFNNPKHPYSQQLFRSLPDKADRNKVLATIPGQVPSLDHAFPLCRFKERCVFVFKPCEQVKPKLISMPDSTKVRCHWYDEKIMATLPKKLLMPKLEEILKLTVHVPDSMPNIALDVPPYPILQVEQLKVHFPIRRGLFKRVVGTIKAVDGVSFPIYEGQTLGLVGESGCGKTTLGKSVLRLIDSNNGKIVFQDTDLAKLSQRKMRKYRHDLQIIFQDPYSSMDPRMRVHDIIEEGMITLNIGSDDQERQDRIDSLLSQVGLSQKHQWRFPHELSGGQRQRVAIARALAVGAKLIICDEPTSALDLSVQAQILNLLRSLQEDLGISFLFITHNIGVVNYLADQIAVMYLGRIVEYGPARAVLDSPKHPYTQALLKSLPTLEKAQQKLEPPKGEVPSITNPPKGCHFSPRCPFVHERCIARYPDAYVAGEQSVKCYLYSPEEIGQINDEKISAPAGA